jgi:hypothetical protein
MAELALSCRLAKKAHWLYDDNEDSLELNTEIIEAGGCYGRKKTSDLSNPAIHVG